MVRIPIRKWEKVDVNPYRPWEPPTPSAVSQGYVDERYRLEVQINGEILGVDVRVPKYVATKDREQFRQHVIDSMSRQIGAVIADEVRRTIA